MLDELKANLGNVMRAYQEENREIPEHLWEQGCLIYLAERAVAEGDETGFLLALNELVSGDTFIA